MIRGLLVGLVLTLMLIPGAYSLSGNYCYNSTVVKNITLDGIDISIEEPCQYGCTPVEGGQFICATSSFVVPIELYIIFQILALIFLFVTLIIRNNDDRDDVPLIFPIMGMITFFVVSAMSFNMAGLAFLFGAIFNGSMGLFMLMFIIIGAMSATKPDTEPINI